MAIENGNLGIARLQGQFRDAGGTLARLMLGEFELGRPQNLAMAAALSAELVLERSQYVRPGSRQPARCCTSPQGGIR